MCECDWCGRGVDSMERDSGDPPKVAGSQARAWRDSGLTQGLEGARAVWNRAGGECDHRTSHRRPLGTPRFSRRRPRHARAAQEGPSRGRPRSRREGAAALQRCRRRHSNGLTRHRRLLDELALPLPPKARPKGRKRGFPLRSGPVDLTLPEPASEALRSPIGLPFRERQWHCSSRDPMGIRTALHLTVEATYSALRIGGLHARFGHRGG
jgi:hypothetical protein